MTPTTSPDEQAPDVRVTPRLVIGLAIMLAGLVLALDSLGFVDGSEVFRFWPLALVAVGVVKWISPPRQPSAGLVWIVAGVGFLLVTFGRMSFVGLWALILLFVGANIAWRALRPAAPRRRPLRDPGHGGRPGGRQDGEPRHGLPRRPGLRHDGRLRDRPAPRVDRRGRRGGDRHLRLLGRDRDQGARGLGGGEPGQRVPRRRSRTRRAPPPARASAWW